MRGRRRGFGMADVLLCMLLVGLMLGLAGVFVPLSAGTAARAERRLHASDLADSQLEAARGAAFGRAAPWSEDSQETWQGIPFHCTCRVQPVAGQDPTLLRKLNVRVEWPELPRKGELVYDLLVTPLQR